MDDTKVIVTDMSGAEHIHAAKRWEDIGGYLHLFDTQAARIATYAPAGWLSVRFDAS